MSIEINGIVRNTSSHPITGYTVAWNGLEILEGDKAQRPRRLVATIEASGKENRFRMPLPSLEDRPTLLGPSRFEVLAPSGTLTGELDLDKEETAKVLAARSVELKAAGLPLGTLSRSDDRALGRPERLTGLVLRVGDGARIGSAQVLLWGHIEPALPPHAARSGTERPQRIFFLHATQAGAGASLCHRFGLLRVCGDCPG